MPQGMAPRRSPGRRVKGRWPPLYHASGRPCRASAQSLRTGSSSPRRPSQLPGADRLHDHGLMRRSESVPMVSGELRFLHQPPRTRSPDLISRLDLRTRSQAGASSRGRLRLSRLSKSRERGADCAEVPCFSVPTGPSIHCPWVPLAMEQGKDSRCLNAPPASNSLPDSAQKARQSRGRSPCPGLARDSGTRSARNSR